MSERGQRTDLVSLLADRGPLTNKEIAGLAGLPVWSVQARMRRLERKGDVRRVQLGPNESILWLLDG